VRTERGLDRLITFLDAVVAIAITLLVLPLVDVLAREAHVSDLAAVFTGNVALFVAFLLSFVVIARLWWAHHRLGELVGAYDTAFVLVNFVWVFTIVLLPFATQVVASFPGHDRGAVATYIGTMTASSACLTVLNLLLRWRPALRREGVEAGELPLVPSVVTTALFGAALVLGVAVPAVNYLALLLLVLSGPTERLVARRTGRRSG
jgi:uncharacterized membrane protein